MIDMKRNEMSKIQAAEMRLATAMSQKTQRLQHVKNIIEENMRNWRECISRMRGDKTTFNRTHKRRYLAISKEIMGTVTDQGLIRYARKQTILIVTKAYDTVRTT